jgi:hypothetical protein
MRIRRLAFPLLVVAAILTNACASNDASMQGGGFAPLDSLECYEPGDVYSSIHSPCAGFLYGDYEQYPSFTPSTRNVVLSGDREHHTRVVTRPGFSDGSGYSPWNANSSASSPPTSSSPPRMDPVVVSAPPAPPTVSRSN